MQIMQVSAEDKMAEQKPVEKQTDQRQSVSTNNNDSRQQSNTGTNSSRTEMEKKAATNFFGNVASKK
jgi:hypothetical protein